jgi:hypothetical protein
MDDIVIYRDGTVMLETTVDEDTVWLSQKQISELFDVKVPAVSKHLKSIFENSELEENSVVSKMEITASDGKRYKTRLYNLDAIISIGYRVNSKRATQFRQWATRVLRQHLLRGYTLDQRRLDVIEEKQLITDKKLEKVMRAIEDDSLRPTQGIFYDGQVFDAYVFIADLIKSAKHSVRLIDNYIDESVLIHFSKNQNIQVTIYTKNITKQLKLDLKKYNSQYHPIELKKLDVSHDRFLILDDAEVYHIGASLKDLGKKWFAFSKMDVESLGILERL